MRADCLPGVVSRSDFEESPIDPRTGTEAGAGSGKAGNDPDGGGLDPHGGWALADIAAPH